MRHLALAHWHAGQWERFGARAVLACWAACWIAFGLISARAAGASPQDVALRIGFPALLFTVIAVLSWRSERAAGTLLLVIAGILALAYRGLAEPPGLADLMAAGIMIAGPAAVSGMLFLLAGHHDGDDG